MNAWGYITSCVCILAVSVCTTHKVITVQMVGLALQTAMYRTGCHEYTLQSLSGPMHLAHLTESILSLSPFSGLNASTWLVAKGSVVGTNLVTKCSTEVHQMPVN